MQYYSNIAKKKKQRKVISALKENRQALQSFVEKSHEKYEVFKNPLTTFQLAASTPEEKLY